MRILPAHLTTSHTTYLHPNPPIPSHPTYLSHPIQLILTHLSHPNPSYLIPPCLLHPNQSSLILPHLSHPNPSYLIPSHPSHPSQSCHPIPPISSQPIYLHPSIRHLFEKHLVTCTNFLTILIPSAKRQNHAHNNGHSCTVYL